MEYIYMGYRILESKGNGRDLLRRRQGSAHESFEISVTSSWHYSEGEVSGILLEKLMMGSG